MSSGHRAAIGTIILVLCFTGLGWQHPFSVQTQLNDQPEPDGKGKPDEGTDVQEWQRGGSYQEWQRGIQKSERKVFSQNGEDGVIEYLFERLGTTDRYYVEFGTQSGVEVNTRLLREQRGWSGLLMDGGNQNKSINLHKAFVMPSTILELFSQFEVPKQFDLLSVDIDSYDLWVWRVLMIAGYRPRVVITEYNRNFMLGCYYTFPDPTGAKVHAWRNKDRLFGASLSAMELLARQYGYVLVYADTLAINAFFVRGDLLPKDALDEVPISKINRPPNRLHGKSSASRAELYVDYLEWSNVYEKSIMSNLGGELPTVHDKSMCMEHI